MTWKKGCEFVMQAKKKPCCLGVGEQGFLWKLGLWGLMGLQSTLLVISLCRETPIFLRHIEGHKANPQSDTQNLSLTRYQQRGRVKMCPVGFHGLY